MTARETTEPTGVAIAHPAREYYSACEGRWCGWLDTRFDPKELDRSPLSLVEKWSIRLMHWCPWRWQIKTSVDASKAASSGLVRHTTWIGRWGIPMYISDEQLVLADDGTTIAMTVQAWRFPGIRQTLGSNAVADADALSVSYEIEWLGGVTLLQYGQRTEAGVTLRQRTPWSDQSQVLCRY